MTKDTETRVNGESTVTRFSVAVNRDFKNKSGEYDADFINCVAFGRTAEFIDKYFSKGMRIGLIGRIQTGSYTNKDGQKVYTTDVVCDRVQLLESRNHSQGQTSSDGGYAPEPQEPYSPSGSDISNSDFDTGPSFDIASDDLPF